MKAKIGHMKPVHGKILRLLADGAYVNRKWSEGFWKILKGSQLVHTCREKTLTDMWATGLINRQNEITDKGRAAIAATQEPANG